MIHIQQRDLLALKAISARLYWLLWPSAVMGAYALGCLLAFR